MFTTLVRAPNESWLAHLQHIFIIHADVMLPPLCDCSSALVFRARGAPEIAATELLVAVELYCFFFAIVMYLGRHLCPVGRHAYTVEVQWQLCLACRLGFVAKMAGV